MKLRTWPAFTIVGVSPRLYDGHGSYVFAVGAEVTKLDENRLETKVAMVAMDSSYYRPYPNSEPHTILQVRFRDQEVRR